MSQNENAQIKDTIRFQCPNCKNVSMRRSDNDEFKCASCNKTMNLQEGLALVKSYIEEIQKMDKFGTKTR